MTALELIRLLLRRWYVVLAGGVLVLGGGSVLLDRPSVHFTQFELVVLPPSGPTTPNVLRDDPYGLSPMAGLLVEEFNRARHPLSMSSTVTTLYGEGLRSGHRVRMRNEGSQWVPVYQRPVIDVQIVDPDRRRVASEAARIAAELDAILQRRQDEVGIRPAARMSLQQAPADPVIQEIRGSRARTAGGLVLLGGALTLVAVIWVERLSRARAARRTRSSRHERELASHPR